VFALELMILTMVERGWKGQLLWVWIPEEIQVPRVEGLL
jgi:hypothetical protein